MLEVSIDFETRALADLRAVGAWRYARHPGTYVLCLAWSEGRAEPRIWQPLFEPLPARLREIAGMAARGEAVFRAWNAAFERNIWNHTLRRGFPDLPELPPEAFVCSMAEALAFGWPGSLEMAAEASGAAEQKDPRGDYLTRVCGSARYALNRANLDGLADYCKQDVRTEMAVATRSRRLSDRERELYLLDQRINDRGVRVDVPAAKAVLRTITAAVDRLNADLPALTGGAVEQATQAARIRTWLASRGIHLPDLAAETVERALKRTDLPDDARKVLRIRQQAGGSAVAKLTPMILVPDPHDHRARGLLQYHGAAATGRWAGRLIQPQNMPRPALKVDGDDLINSFVDGTALDRFGDDVFAAASDALRPLLTATPGNVLARADLNAIEARIVLWLAGHSDAMDLFRTGACIYCEMASAVYGRRITKAENPVERQVGKVIVLGCFGPDTLVLTDKGYIRIVDVSKDMKVWDGVRWTTHGGVVARGERETIQHLGVWATPDHRVWTGKRWAQWGFLARGAFMSRQALATASATLPLSAWNAAPVEAFGPSGANAVAATPFLLRKISYATAAPTRAASALGARLRRPSQRSMATLTYARASNTEGGCSTASPRSFNGATTRSRGVGRTTGGAASRSGRHGAKIGRPSWPIYSLSLGGMRPRSNSTEPTTPGGMSPATSGSSRGAPTLPTAEPSRPYSKKMPTYDIALSGPRRRFVIWSAGGPLLVHNCGYQMGAARFQEHAAANGVVTTLAEAETFVKAYRSRWHLVPKLWRGLEAACVAAATRGGIYSYRGVDFALHDGAILCRLPSGRRLVWQGASVHKGEYGPQVWVKRTRAGQWEDVALYGGILAERVTQALARDVMAEGMLRVERAGVPVVLTVHDEMVTDTSRTDAETILVQCMTEAMPWAPDLPLAAEATSAFRYGK